MSGITSAQASGVDSDTTNPKPFIHPRWLTLRCHHAGRSPNYGGNRENPPASGRCSTGNWFLQISVIEGPNKSWIAQLWKAFHLENPPHSRLHWNTSTPMLRFQFQNQSVETLIFRPHKYGVFPTCPRILLDHPNQKKENQVPHPNNSQSPTKIHSFDIFPQKNM